MKQQLYFLIKFVYVDYISKGELKSKWNTTEKAYIEKLFEANVNQYVVEDLEM